MWGSYRYGENNAGPHAVTQAGTRNYTYDVNGNMVSGDGRTLTWSSFNKPTRMERNGRFAEFKYGPNHSRYQKMNHQGDVTLYVGGLYERVAKPSETIQKHYIMAAGQLVAEHIVSTQNGTQTRYMHKDSLGSIDTITDNMAEVVDRRSYDAWGKLRDFDWKAGETITKPSYETELPFTNKAFTGHEQIQEVDLIHMNGRVYDATLGRFLSADPHIQAGSLSQSYNRYTYVMNNPLKFTDPSGYFFAAVLGNILKKVWKAIKPYAGIIVGAVISFYCPICTGPIMQATLAGAAAGAVGAAVSGGNIFRGAITGAISGLVTAGLGSPQLGLKGAALAAAQGVFGGMMSVIQGGKFGQGFMSASFSSFAGAKFGTGTNPISNALRSALIGGTASVLGGGKFANGARSGAMSYAINAGVGSAFNRSSAQAETGDGYSSCDPINISTGEKYLTMVDYKASGASRLKFERFYSSFSEDTTSLGHGWRSNFDRQLTFEFDGSSSELPWKIIYQRQDRKHVEFKGIDE